MVGWEAPRWGSPQVSAPSVRALVGWEPSHLAPPDPPPPAGTAPRAWQSWPCVSHHRVRPPLRALQWQEEWQRTHDCAHSRDVQFGARCVSNPEALNDPHKHLRPSPALLFRRARLVNMLRSIALNNEGALNESACGRQTQSEFTLVQALARAASASCRAGPSQGQGQGQGRSRRGRSRMSRSGY